MKKVYFLFFYLFISRVLVAQTALEYFPDTTGYRWFYSITPYDTLQQLVDSLSTTRVDSFTHSTTYEGKDAKEILSKYGPKETVLDSPYIDTNYVNFEASNISLYLKALPINIDTQGIGGFLSGIQGWYSAFRLASTVNTSYTLYTKDTNVTISNLDLIITTEVKAKRLADQTLNTAIGTFLCKKFIITPAIKAKLAAFPIITYTVFSMNDTAYIAPGNFVVLQNTPSSKVDLSMVSMPSFWVPGTKIEILAPPGVLEVNPLRVSVPFSEGDTSVSITNVGPGTLKWNARVLTGGDWLSITSDTMGVNNSLLNLHYTQNNSQEVRTATVQVWDDSSFSPRQTITITQNGTTGITDRNGSTDLNFNLFNNYPNPFNPATVITFSLKEKSFVSLKVYNALGKEVITLSNEIKEAGIYKVQFNASELPSGVYFYKINAGKFSSVKKMMLIK